jgi:DNA polymerase III alpha subunit (gram-positive type)
LMIDVVVDVEADGPCPGLYSMVSFGAVATVNGETRKFYSGILEPVSPRWIPEALAVSGITREQQENGASVYDAISDFEIWLEELGDKPIFWSDNLAFDWQFINYYTHAYIKRNPFGFSGRRIGDLYAGYMKNVTLASKWKYLRKTKHTHNPVDDAMGNLEALIEIKRMLRKCQ